MPKPTPKPMPMAAPSETPKDAPSAVWSLTPALELNGSSGTQVSQVKESCQTSNESACHAWLHDAEGSRKGGKKSTKQRSTKGMAMHWNQKSQMERPTGQE